MPYESYYGKGFSVKYKVKVTVLRSYSANLCKEVEFYVIRPRAHPPYVLSLVRTEVGLEDALHIEIELNQFRYHIKGCVSGHVYFHIVGIAIERMLVYLVRKEEVNGIEDSSVIEQYEVMDGAASRSDSIPIRIHLKHYDLTPTFMSINSLSVRYYLKFSIEDDQGRAFNKEIEIKLWR